MGPTDFQSATTEIPRDQWGRPKVLTPDGKLVGYQRCTTFVDVLDDKYNLQKWQQRMVAVGLARRPDLHLAVSSLADDPDGAKRDLDRLCDDAREAAAASSKATVGTALHQLTERLDRGLDTGFVPEAYRPHLDAYQRATVDMEAVHIEQFCVLDDWRVGGTPDRILKIPGVDGLIVGDVKTGAATLRYGMGKVAMQMAVYAHSLLYNHETQQRAPIEGIRHDKGLVIALDAETGACELHWVDLAAGWEACQLARQVHAWRKRKDLSSPYAAAAPVVDVVAQRRELATSAGIENAIASATTVDELAALWAEAASAGQWTDALTAAAAARKAALTAA